MGDYTEIHFNVELVRDVPVEVTDVLRYMVGYLDEQPPLPEHPLFGDTRWRRMLRCNSDYFPMSTSSTCFYDDIASRWFLSVRSNFKNYDDEINLFIDWIDPYVDAYPGEFLGFHRFEQDEDPTLIRKSSEDSEDDSRRDRHAD